MVTEPELLAIGLAVADTPPTDSAKTGVLPKIVTPPRIIAAVLFVALPIV